MTTPPNLFMTIAISVVLLATPNRAEEDFSAVSQYFSTHSALERVEDVDHTINRPPSVKWSLTDTVNGFEIWKIIVIAVSILIALIFIIALSVTYFVVKRKRKKDAAKRQAAAAHVEQLKLDDRNVNFNSAVPPKEMASIAHIEERPPNRTVKESELLQHPVNPALPITSTFPGGITPYSGALASSISPYVPETEFEKSLKNEERKEAKKHKKERSESRIEDIPPQAILRNVPPELTSQVNFLPISPDVYRSSALPPPTYSSPPNFYENVPINTRGTHTMITASGRPYGTGPPGSQMYLPHLSITTQAPYSPYSNSSAISENPSYDSRPTDRPLPVTPDQRPLPQLPGAVPLHGLANERYVSRLNRYEQLSPANQFDYLYH